MVIVKTMFVQSVVFGMISSVYFCFVSDVKCWCERAHACEHPPLVH